MTYTLPKGFYVPLRGNTTKKGASAAQSVFGQSKPARKDIKCRNPKSYIKKSGDMSQRFKIRS